MDGEGACAHHRWAVLRRLLCARVEEAVSRDRGGREGVLRDRPSWSHVLGAKRNGAGGGVSTFVLQTKTYLKRVEVVAKLRRVARRRHSAAVAHFSSTTLAAEG